MRSYWYSARSVAETSNAPSGKVLPGLLTGTAWITGGLSGDIAMRSFNLKG